VLAIESHRPAAEQASRAAHDQRLSLRSLAADAAIEIERRAAEGERWDAIAVDPPRRGLPPSLRHACAALAPRATAYASGEPAPLARDLDHFARLGYRADRALAIDLMPQTDEVEALVVLTRGDPIEPRVIHRDDRLIAVDKPPHEPTTPQDGRVRSLLDRV